MEQLNILNKIGLWFFNNIDKKGLIFSNLKNQKKWIRYVIYTLLLISTYFSTTYLNEQILIKLSSYANENIYIFENIFNTVKYSILIVISTIICYETIYKYTLEEILNYEKSKNKKPFLSKWYFRIILYFIVFFILSQILYIYILNTNLEQYAAISNLQNHEIILKFNSLQEKAIFENNLSIAIENAFKKFYSFFFIVIFIYEISLLRKKYDN